jgi:hypothetical protein
VFKNSHFPNAHFGHQSKALEGVSDDEAQPRDLLLLLLSLLGLDLLLHCRGLEGFHHLGVFLLEALHLLKEGMPVILKGLLLLLHLLELFVGTLALRA